ncbi:hypothetical protein IE81DRAFT_369492 [Ceraceosorus guamensis]|uniref:G-protein coupled receptors family 1 profile domain-containing protein n=1 Tax=Ceraceosorus guamensis TaxID=1522189 RepID=A0A316VNL5_9BASI|nr:hypothetical protein IE81DRAFT_369492 [Ceraceosorus guamensis]PWN38910.1 hypothetical protein IE81DRAFT_369492 [Ceraceosorus guamensis]
MADSSPERLVALILEISKAAAPVAYLGCVCLGLVIGDFFGALEWELALARECKRRVMVAYFMARTCSVIALSVLIALMSVGSFKIDICGPLTHVMSTFIALSTASAQYLYVGRVTSIWQARPWVKYLMLLTWSLSALSWIPLIVFFVGLQNPVGLLVCIPAEPVSNLTTIPYFFNMMYDLLVFALIVVGFHRQGKLNLFKRKSTDSDLTRHLVVTTILYFTILSLFLIGQTIAFWVAQSPARKVLSAPLHAALVAIISCRLFRNLRQLARGDSPLPTEARSGGGTFVGRGASSNARRDLNAEFETYAGAVHLHSQSSRQAASEEHTAKPMLSEYSKGFGNSLSPTATPSINNSALRTPDIFEGHGWAK